MSPSDLYTLDLGLDPEPAFTPDPYTPHNSNFYDDDEPEILPAVRASSLPPWPPNLPRELALGGESIEATLTRCGCTEADYFKWAAIPAFRREISDANKELAENGTSFKMLCRGIAKDFLPVLDQKLHDPCVPLALKADIFKYVTKVGGLEPKEEKGPSGGGTTVAIQINL